jgi:hypothetical protein
MLDRFLEALGFRSADPMLAFIRDHGSPPRSRATIPFGSPVLLSRWKKSRNRVPARARLGCDEQLAAVFGLLCGAAVGEVEKRRLQNLGIDALRLPTSIEVAGGFLGRDEASINGRAPTSGPSQIRERAKQSFEECASVRRRARSATKLLPGRLVDARRQIARGLVDVR